ncbi:MAG: aspartokinase/homoserine dehydrogenase 1 [Patiriisocius sp.]|jgi:aspartokinase/homoserine dehydrogenase 1
MKVLKFGGSSVATADSIKKVWNIAIEAAKNDKAIIVVSAFGGVTDLLQRAGEQANLKDETYLKTLSLISERHHAEATQLKLSDTAINHLEDLLEQLKNILQGIYLINEFSDKTIDKVLSYGELLSAFLISEMSNIQDISVSFKDSRELLKTDVNFTRADILQPTTDTLIQEYFRSDISQLTIMPGFISSTVKGETTTLGRGGSDYTAAILAAALDVKILEIWTDVSGMYTANPKLVAQAYAIPEISYHEAMELSHFGAKVLYPPTIVPLLQKNIPIMIKNTFEPLEGGTLITDSSHSKKKPVKGITHLSNIALLTLEGNGMVGIPGISKRLFEALSAVKVNIILITQASSEHSICVAVDAVDTERASTAIDTMFKYEIASQELQPTIVEHDLAIIAVIGDGMKNHQGISGDMFSVLGNNNVNIRAIAQGASERNISAVIAKKDVTKALNVLHYRFFEKQIKTINLFIVGVGNVGARLLAQIAQQQAYLLTHLMLKINVVGLSNSRKMLFDSNGISLDNWQEQLDNGQSNKDDAWFKSICELNLATSVFVDITANDTVAAGYGRYLKQSIAVVACNKIASSNNFSNYKELKELSKKYHTPYLFETNVGAGLPVINTLNNLINSGDQVTEIQAVLSGSLNFIFNNFNKERSFYDVVLQAQQEGYTEPDPRIDLSGVDVARKIVILARESGYEIEMDEIENKSFLSNSGNNADSVPQFLATLKTDAAHYEALFNKAEGNSSRLKYVASLKNGKASVGLQEIPKSHPFYNLDGKDNIVLFYTNRYVDQPLIIKGAGAGADVTASGLFGDIISLKNV